MHHVSIFYKVVILQQIVQEAGNDLDTIKFRQLLMRLCDGLSTETDWKSLYLNIHGYLMHLLSYLSKGTPDRYTLHAGTILFAEEQTIV